MAASREEVEDLEEINYYAVLNVSKEVTLYNDINIVVRHLWNYYYCYYYRMTRNILELLTIYCSVTKFNTNL